MEFVEHWHIFLQRNPEARIIVEGVMARTGLPADEVLFLLMDEWATDFLSHEKRPATNDWMALSTTVN